MYAPNFFMSRKTPGFGSGFSREGGFSHAPGRGQCDSMYAPNFFMSRKTPGFGSGFSREGGFSHAPGRGQRGSMYAPNFFMSRKTPGCRSGFSREGGFSHAPGRGQRGSMYASYFFMSREIRCPDNHSAHCHTHRIPLRFSGRQRAANYPGARPVAVSPAPPAWRVSRC